MARGGLGVEVRNLIQEIEAKNTPIESKIVSVPLENSVEDVELSVSPFDGVPGDPQLARSASPRRALRPIECDQFQPASQPLAEFSLPHIVLNFQLAYEAGLRTGEFAHLSGLIAAPRSAPRLEIEAVRVMSQCPFHGGIEN
jgi:hypothetical protein